MTEQDYDRLCELAQNIMRRRPELTGAALYDAVTAVLVDTGFEVDHRETEILRSTRPHGVTVLEVGGEPVLLTFDDDGFSMWDFTPEDVPELVAEADACNEFYDKLTELPALTAEDLSSLLFVKVFGGRFYEYNDLMELVLKKEDERQQRWDEQRSTTIELPDEFLLLCEQYGLTPQAALRGFIADVCGIKNYSSNPRQDGYCSNGSDEREQARAYFDRAHWRPEVEEKHGIGLSTFW